MKKIKYKGKVVSYAMEFTTIYMINCVDFDFKSKVFTYVKHNEMYESKQDALSQIKKDVYRLHENSKICCGCFIKENNRNEFETIYQNNDSYKRRTYIIKSMSWDNRDLEKNL